MRTNKQSKDPGLRRIPRETISAEEELNPRKRLLRRILARRDAIETAKGVLQESYPLIREDRER